MCTTAIEQALQIALAHHQVGELAQAEALYRQVLAIQPRQPDALHLLGLIAHQTGQHDSAIELILQAIVQKPDEPTFYLSLGEAYGALRRLDDAEGCYRRALAIRPDFVEALNNLGNVFKDQGKFDEAVACYKRALKFKPDLVDAHNNLGAAFEIQGRMDEAVGCFQQALEIRPDYAAAYSNLAIVFRDQGRLDEALKAYRNVIRLQPEKPLKLSSLLFTLYMHHGLDPQTILEEHRRWEMWHGQSRQHFQQSHSNRPEPDRRIKIGYVSSRFWNNPEGRFLRPVLENHNHNHFEIICYADVAEFDRFTDELRSCADLWRNIIGVSEEGLAEQIRADDIDLLVDLSLHTPGNRLTVFARKPAPVQATYLAYPGTSGISAMDYRLTDPYLDPPGENDAYYSETSVHLPETYWCYQAPEEALSEVTPLPALSTGHITFGCLNNFSKVNRHVLTVWAKLLRMVPNSRFVLFGRQVGSHWDLARAVIAEQGINPTRLYFVSHTPMADYYSQYEQFDIALDTFPYAGGTTTCDALWMGVPVVSLVGRTAVGRGGLSILSNIGLPEMAAQTEDEYVQIAVDLANDLPRLTHLRATMRERMQASPLMDAPRFAQNIEAAYRAMWQKWCEGQTQGKTLQGDNHVHNHN